MNTFFRCKLIGLHRRAVDAFWEWRFGADTTGLPPGSTPDADCYGTVPYGSIFQVLRALKLGPGDELVDLGCGKGRVLLCASRLPIARAVGVEHGRDVAAVAQRHVLRLAAPRCPVEVLNQNVLEFDYRRGTAFYLFDPYGPTAVRGFLARLRAGIDCTPRWCALAFIPSVAPQSEAELFACWWLECYRVFDIIAFDGQTLSVSLWRSRA